MIATVKLMVKKLHELLGLPVIPNDITRVKPPYPYITYKIITPYIPARGQPNLKREVVENTEPEEGSLFRYDIKETITDQPTFTISFNAFGDNSFSTIELAGQVLNILKSSIYFDLKDINAVVVDSTSVSDRSMLIVDHYEYRYGFDLRVRITDRSTITIEAIEEMKIEGEKNE